MFICIGTGRGCDVIITCVYNSSGVVGNTATHVLSSSSGLEKATLMKPGNLLHKLTISCLVTLGGRFLMKMEWVRCKARGFFSLGSCSRGNTTKYCHAKINPLKVSTFITKQLFIFTSPSSPFFFSTSPSSEPFSAFDSSLGASGMRDNINIKRLPLEWIVESTDNIPDYLYTKKAVAVLRDFVIRRRDSNLVF